MREIAYYETFLSKALLDHLLALSKPVNGVDGLSEVGVGGGLESVESFRFLCELYDRTKEKLNAVLEKRVAVRKFVDERTKASFQLNARLGVDYLDPLYATVMGQQDAKGEILVGPLPRMANDLKPIAPIPSFLQGPHVTLFGPPDDAKLSINAMNAYYRKIPGEPAIVAEVLKSQTSSPMWGADDEDSKTPLRADLVEAGVNLCGCFDGTLAYTDPKTKKSYALEKEKLSLPLKRIPGLALPSQFLFLRGNPIPLHLYDFALHLFRCHDNPKALTFYIPKLESKDEAEYVHAMVETAEKLLKERFPKYRLGTVRLLIVLENPRAIFHTHEIMDTLYPYFAGASLGWHDFLASTARLFKEDANYRIPVKADPDIVVKYIKASHEILAETVGPRGGIKIGGMYGVLPIDTDLWSPSFQVTIKGFIRDAIIQMKRDLSGFWVAHPDFVRIGLALVEGWRLFKEGNEAPLEKLVTGLLDKSHHAEILKFIHGEDVAGLDKQSPLFPRSLIVADIKQSNFIANNHPDEIRYNVFQSLQYLTDWLSGNGCVALPAQIGAVPVRVMDDLATAERSRWEVWHEIHYKRFSVEALIEILHEELLYIRKDLSDGKKIVQVKWNERTRKWYPVSARLLLQLMTSEKPVEFASELLLPFTVDSIREQEDPLSAVRRITGSKYSIEPYVERLHDYFEICGHLKFAVEMAKGIPAEEILNRFSKEDVIAAARFHGDIGEAKAGLDAAAAKEQALVEPAGQLLELGAEYKKKFGMKFLISAKGRTAAELLKALKERISGSAEQELKNARQALYEISEMRLASHPSSVLRKELESGLQKHSVKSAMVAVSSGTGLHQTLCFGTTADTWFEFASLSKSVASCFALEFFQQRGISLETPVNRLFKNFQIKPPKWGDRVTLRHLMQHSALNMHYVDGVPASQPMPPVTEWLKEVEAVREPGTAFGYSGGGFLVLEHLIESLAGKSIAEITEPFLVELGISQMSFDPTTRKGIRYATGFSADGKGIAEGGRKMFPSFAAGAMGTADAMLVFLSRLTRAFHDIDSTGISHATAVQLLHGVDNGSVEFMGTKIGLGVFTLEAGPNRFAVHQGANDGFRCLYLYCYDGPDRDKGFVIVCNADENGVEAVAEIAQRLLNELNIVGIDRKRFLKTFDASAISPEQVVNRGYKELIFGAFEPDLPEALEHGDELEPFAKENLAVASTIVSTSNQGFARAENLISPHTPTFDPQAYGRQGKIMDSWETVRHNPMPSDWLVLKLKKPSTIKLASFSTQYHLGNHAPFVKLEGKTDESSSWREIIPKTALEGHARVFLMSMDPKTVFQTIRVSILPDGGLTRLGLYDELLPGVETGKRLPFREKIPQPFKPLAPKYLATEEAVRKNWGRVPDGAEVDLASLAFGGKILSASNEHYGPAVQVISPYPPIDMFDGFESARSRVVGHSENVVIGLAKPSSIHRIELDFRHFKNNNPVEIALEGLTEGTWIALQGKTGVKAYAGNSIALPLDVKKIFSAIKVLVYPDGGINRVRVFGIHRLSL